MLNEVNKPEKAYKSLPFLNSPDARALRILAEYLEPMQRFQKEQVQDTIVFFGSARSIPQIEAQNRFDKLKNEAKGSSDDSKVVMEELRMAETALDFSRFYEDAVKLAALLTSWSLDSELGRRFVVCSGGGPGIMEAANKGAHQAGGQSIGLNISLPFEQHANPYITDGLNFEFHYFFMRKLWFVYLAKAVVVFPGGFGTLDEFMEVLTLLQTKKTTKSVPIVIYGTEFWNEILNFEALVKWGVISPEDLQMFHFADTPEEASEYLIGELQRIHL